MVKPLGSSDFGITRSTNSYTTNTSNEDFVIGLTSYVALLNSGTWSLTSRMVTDTSAVVARFPGASSSAIIWNLIAENESDKLTAAI
jgi:hypothetical protein